MTYTEIFNKAQIARQIPLVFEGRSLPTDMNASVVLLRVQYEKFINELNTLMQDVSKQLKKEGFDDRQKEYNDMHSVFERKAKAEKGEEGVTMPTESELKKAEETKLKEEDIAKEITEFNESYNKAYIEKLKETVDIKERLFTPQELNELIKLIGVEGTIKINDNEVSKEQFINTIAVLFA